MSRCAYARRESSLALRAPTPPLAAACAQPTPRLASQAERSSPVGSPSTKAASKAKRLLLQSPVISDHLHTVDKLLPKREFLAISPSLAKATALAAARGTAATVPHSCLSARL